MSEPLACWCGNEVLAPFCPGYARCPACETLVSSEMPTGDIAHVLDEERDFYGREYWFSHQERHLGLPTIVDRARTDLPERCLYWLQTLLRYRRPPARVLEVGCGHGGFVAMLRWAGFEATGLEISPWVVDFARELFGVPVLTGPVEDQSIAAASLDVIALMDVLEHLRDPAGTMRHCLRLLKPDGIVVIQTPCYPEGSTYEEMTARSERPLEILAPREHLYLFSRSSIRELCTQLGAPHLAFEPALFARYDMFPVVSRVPLAACAPAEARPPLTGTPAARMAQALLDERAAVEHLTALHAESEADRARRLAVIDAQGHRLGEVEAERSNLRAEVATRRSHMEAVEADRAARLGVIEEQGRRLGDVEAERNNLRAEASALREQLAAGEADRVGRLALILEQERRIAASEAEVAVQTEQIQILMGQLRRLQHVLTHVQGTRVYRLLRQLGRWTFIDQMSSMIAVPRPHARQAAGLTRSRDLDRTGEANGE